MSNLQFFTIVLGGIINIISIIVFLLKNYMNNTSNMVYKDKLNILENNNKILTNNFEILYEVVKDLTNEIKILSNKLEKNKDIK